MLQEYEALEDPRQSDRCLYPLQEMLLVALCAYAATLTTGCMWPNGGVTSWRG